MDIHDTIVVKEEVCSMKNDDNIIWLSYLKDLSHKVNNLKTEVAKNFNCDTSDIYLGDYIPDSDTTVCSYKVIYGDAIFRLSNVTDLGALEYIVGDADFECTKLKSFNNLKIIYGDAYFGNSFTIIKKIALDNIVNDIEYDNFNITDIGSLEGIKGNIFFNGIDISNNNLIDIINNNKKIVLKKNKK